MKTTFLFLILTFSYLDAQSTNDAKVVCYYTDWSVYRMVHPFTPSHINPYLCTHLIYAFFKFDTENVGLEPFDPYQDIDRGGFKEFNEVKGFNDKVKTLGAIGGWREGSATFSKIAGSRERRKLFTKNTISFLRKYNFDGINLDWHVPGFRDGSIDDFENYVTLVKEMREGFESEPNVTDDKKLLLTLSVPANTEYIEGGFDLGNLHLHVDFMTILCYDYHLSTEPYVNHHSKIYPLLEDMDDPTLSKLNMNWTVNYILQKGVPNNKLVIGIPAFGRTFKLEDENENAIGSVAESEGAEGISTREVGYQAYYEICSTIRKENWTVVHPNKTAMGPYAYKGINWVGFDDEDSARRKGEYAGENRLGGIMIWTIDDDDFKGICGGKGNSLIRAAREGFFSKIENTNTPSPTKSPTTVTTTSTEPTTASITRTYLPPTPRTNLNVDTPSKNNPKPIQSNQSPKNQIETIKPKATHVFSGSDTRKEDGVNFYQNISLWIINNVFNFGNTSAQTYDVKLTF